MPSADDPVFIARQPFAIPGGTAAITVIAGSLGQALLLAHPRAADLNGVVDPRKNGSAGRAPASPTA